VFPGSPAKAANVFPGSALPERSVAAPYRAAIREKLDIGLSLQRIWRDLVEEPPRRVETQSRSEVGEFEVATGGGVWVAAGSHPYPNRHHARRPTSSPPG